MANQQRVAVLGAGVMGEALIAALIRFGIAPTSISIAEKRKERSDELVERYGVVAGELASVASTCDIVLLVVKPQDFSTLLSELAPHLRDSALVMSFAAGKTISAIALALPKNPIVRVMPNTPTSIGLGAAGYSCGLGVSTDDRLFVSGFLAAAGLAVEVDESLQDAITATSGSGPAYFFAFVEAIIDGAVALGLSQADATELTIQTLVGSAALLERSGESPKTLREKVTSPNGTTAAALHSLSESGLNEIVARAMVAAHKRSQELA